MTLDADNCISAEVENILSLWKRRPTVDSPEDYVWAQSYKEFFSVDLSYAHF